MKRLLFLACACLSATSTAHEGETHHDEAAPAPPSVTAPHRLPDGSLFLPKAAQHLLGIRTAVWPLAQTASERLVGEVQAQPNAALAVTAAEAGQLQASGAWPLPGQDVAAGQLLAWLHPRIGQRERARRRALAAELEQKLVIAGLNVDRLGLQGAVNAEGQVASGNIYLEQARAERDALLREQALLLDSLADRVPLRATASGRVLAVSARAGQIVETGQVVFQLADPARLRLVAITDRAGWSTRLRAATARIGDHTAALRLRGEEPLADAPGWRLLFDLDGEWPLLAPGEAVNIELETDAASPADRYCVTAADGTRVVWVHHDAEHFVSTACVEAQLASGERVVVEGRGLLSQYR